MIGSVEIKRLRGIREGKVDHLTPLVVLVGPNGSGKSTVIEAILIGSSPNTADAMVQVVRRHEAGGSGPRWLLWRGGEMEPTEITVRSAGGNVRLTRLALERGRPEPESVIKFWLIDDTRETGQGFLRGVKNKYHDHKPAGLLPFGRLTEVHLIEGYPTRFQKHLHELYTRAIQRGHRKDIMAIVSELIPDATNLEILTEHGEPILHLDVKDEYAIPADLVGDGIHALLRLSLELAGSGGGMALLEEPEVHQHPGAIRQTAKAILAAVRRGIQVVLTTHSLELIDALHSECSDKDLTQLSLYRLLLREGKLLSSRLSGAEVALARTVIQDDLR